jgi:uncharacterized membrane protein YeaQ/YmgE (transglycosylase-associated protein family)
LRPGRTTNAGQQEPIVSVGHETEEAMNDIEKLLADPYVTLILIILIGAVIGWFYEEWTHSPHGYITSALVGVAGSYTGYDLAKLATMPGGSAIIRLLAAAVGALIVLWAWRTFHLHGKRKRKR